MITAIDDQGLLHWHCIILDEEGDIISCGQEKTARLEEVEYLDSPCIDEPGRGAVMAMPRCATCGTRMFLPADYTLKELRRACLTLVDQHGAFWAYALPFRYMYNLRVQWSLYEAGRALRPPVVPLPDAALLAQPASKQLGTRDVVDALWVGYYLARERGDAQLLAQPS